MRGEDGAGQCRYGWTNDRLLATVVRSEHDAEALLAASGLGASGWVVTDFPRHPDRHPLCWWQHPDVRSPADTHKQRMWRRSLNLVRPDFVIGYDLPWRSPPSLRRFYGAPRREQSQ